MISADSFIEFAGLGTLAMLLIGMAMVLWRLARGPTAADRVIALDLLSMLVVAFLVAVSIHAQETSYLDVAIAYACISFLGTVALARYITRTSRRRSEQKQGDHQND
ncbi:MAG: cation:proton antiporter [Deltaproteobacteria bacterium]|nr:cation:proton antiporter [Deltaproteobacteria bacterium]